MTTEEIKPKAKCNKCGHWKPVNAFYKKRHGLPATICIECRAAYLKGYYARNREAILAKHHDKKLKRRGWKEIRNPAPGE